MATAKQVTGLIGRVERYSRYKAELNEIARLAFERYAEIADCKRDYEHRTR